MGASRLRVKTRNSYIILQIIFCVIILIVKDFVWRRWYVVVSEGYQSLPKFNLLLTL